MPVTIKNRWTGDAIATVDDTDDLREAVIKLVRQGVSLSAADLSDANLSAANLRAADLSDANLSDANLRAANLSDANLRAANLRAANLSDADLSDANLRAANLDSIRDDLFAVLSFAPAEVPALIAALEGGKINGSTYCDGECGCLVGTLAMASGATKTSSDCAVVHGLHGLGSRPIERFFLCIKLGDTPENNHFAKLAHKWSTEWLGWMQAAFPLKEQTA